MKRLLLLRHAKSSWEDPELADHERPLAPRGRRAAKLIAKHLGRVSTGPDLVLCSTARRARETLDGIAGALGEHIVVRLEDGLYGASERRLLERVQAVDDEVDSVLLIGHNPAIEDLAIQVAAGGDKLAALESKFPTGALATLEFDGRWQDLGPGTATLADFVTPKDLAKR
jgi:phosphohistidine phosphatase